MPSDFNAPAGAPIDTEAAHGVDALDVLQARLDSTTEEWSKLGALHGPFGKYNDVRKSYLGATAVQLRDEWDTTKGKLTESQLEQLAHAHENYTAFVDQAVLDHARYLLLDAERDGIMQRIQRGNNILRVAARGF